MSLENAISGKNLLWSLNLGCAFLCKSILNIQMSVEKCCLPPGKSRHVLIGVKKWKSLSFTHYHVVSNPHHCILRSTKGDFTKFSCWSVL
ncbi:Cell cycle checkpoint control protein RAD9A [Labeo rohita]|uniref:Cell cycle checkpoint control protein RAD9A n=1 Tax=Labeo rohita TaxID=84645 RepID=A0ABQ8N187_LABRO|nr:Cell cycle checkpoint control protein RAD9A [Labeo rohita]